MAVTTVKKKPIRGNLDRADLYAIGTGQVIGAGIVTYTITCLKMTGYSAWIAYVVAILLGFVLILPNLLASKVLRINGGFYSVVSSTMGGTGAGIFSYVFVLSLVGISTFIRATTEYIGDIIPALNSPTMKIALGMGLIAFFLIVNLLGMDVFAKVQKLMVWILLASLVLFIVFGLPKVHLPIFDFNDPDFLINGIFKFTDGQLTGGLFLAMFSFMNSTYGYGVIVGYGGQAKNAKKDMAPAMFLSMLTILVLYTLVAIVAAGCMSIKEYGDSTTLVYVAQRIMPGPLVYVFVIGGPVMALLTTINSSFNSASITIAKSVEDGWFPAAMAKKNRFGAFKWPLVLLTIFASVPVLLGFNIQQLLAYLGPISSSPVLIYLFGFLRFPKKFPEVFDKPGGVGKKFYYVATVAAIIIQLAVFLRGVLASGPHAVIISLGALAIFIGAGVLRSKKGNVTIYDAVWDVDEPAELVK